MRSGPHVIRSGWDVRCRLPMLWPLDPIVPSLPRVDPVPHDAPKPPGYTRFVCVSDTHSRTDPIQMPYGDVLIHAGDFTELGLPSEVKKFNEWLGRCQKGWRLGAARLGADPCLPPFLPAPPGPSLAFVTCPPPLGSPLTSRTRPHPSDYLVTPGRSPAPAHVSAVTFYLWDIFRPGRLTSKGKPRFVFVWLRVQPPVPGPGKHPTNN